MADDLDNFSIGCGHPEEWDFVAKNYGPAVDELVHAHSTCFELLPSAKPDGQEQNVLYLLAASCLKEFEEICLLAGNGYGTGATKLLRAFYERVVTFSYLALKPDKVQQFIDYTDVHSRKMLDETEKIHANTDLAPEKIRVINETFENSRERFTEYVCKPLRQATLTDELDESAGAGAGQSGE
jgi:hypothetical protein